MVDRIEVGTEINEKQDGSLFFVHCCFIIIIIIIIFIIYKAQYPNMLKALYNKIKSYLLCVKSNINNNKYNCKIYFQIKQMQKR